MHAGHSEDSICLYGQTDGVLFAGDTPIVIRSSGDSYDDRFVWALEWLCQKEVRTIYFWHGNAITQDAHQMLVESLKNVRTAQTILRKFEKAIHLA